MTLVATVLVSAELASVTTESLDQRVPRGTRTHETRRQPALVMSWRRNYIGLQCVHMASGRTTWLCKTSRPRHTPRTLLNRTVWFHVQYYYLPGCRQSARARSAFSPTLRGSAADFAGHGIHCTRPRSCYNLTGSDANGRSRGLPLRVGLRLSRASTCRLALCRVDDARM